MSPPPLPPVTIKLGCSRSDKRGKNQVKNMATYVCPSGAGLRLGSLAPPSYHWLESQDRATQRIRRQALLLCTCKTHTAKGVSPGGEKAEGINAISIFNVILTSSANIHFKLAYKTLGFRYDVYICV